MLFSFCANVSFRFLPSLARASLEKSLGDCSIQDTVDPAEARGLSCKFHTDF